MENRDQDLLAAQRHTWTDCLEIVWKLLQMEQTGVKNYSFSVWAPNDTHCEQGANNCLAM